MVKIKKDIKSQVVSDDENQVITNFKLFYQNKITQESPVKEKINLRKKAK